jgi:hypothetical protein
MRMPRLFMAGMSPPVALAFYLKSTFLPEYSIITSELIAIMVAKIHDVGTRPQALCMLEDGCKLADIITDTDISQSSTYRLRQEALKRGYDKDVSRKLLLSYVADAP